MIEISSKEVCLRPHSVLRTLGWVTLFNASIAFLFTIGLGSSFWENMVFSMCIGTLAYLLIDTSWRFLLNRGKQPGLLSYVVLIAISAAVAFIGGMTLAGWLLNIPQSNLADHVNKHKNFYLTFLLIAFGTSSTFFWNRGKIAALEAEAAQEKARSEAIERQALQAQLQLLQAQIEPHMLFNTLANLQGLIAIDAPRAQLMLDQLIHYLRATLTSSRATTTTLAQEFSLMQAYLGLMSVRMGTRLTFTLNLPAALQTLSIPPMLLQPLVENAIQHGLEPKIDGGHIDVSACNQSGRITLTITDTGLGLHAGIANKSGTHLGLVNIRERLQALYGEKAALSVGPGTSCGTIAQLELPLGAS